MSEHPNAITLERHSVGDLPAQVNDEVAAHVDACDACRALVAELRGEQVARIAAVSPDQFVARVAARRDVDADLGSRRRKIFAGGGIATLVAAAAMLLLIPRAGVRLKGAGFAIHRNRAGAVRVLESADGIRAGDALRLTVTVPHATSATAWVVDQHGRVDRFSAAQLTSGENALPDSVVVEAPCVDLNIVVGFDDEVTEAMLHRTSAALPRGALVRSLHCE